MLQARRPTFEPFSFQIRPSSVTISRLEFIDESSLLFIRYDQVLSDCSLIDDLRLLPEGDETIVSWRLF